MGFLKNLFQKKEKIVLPEVIWPVTISSPASGLYVPMAELKDPVFAEGILGKAFGIEPTEGLVYSPVDGTIVTLTDTLHAITIKGIGEIDILVHIGIDTVKMKGDGFTALVKQGEIVRKGTPILKVDLDRVCQAGYVSTIITAFVNTDEFSVVDFMIREGDVLQGDDVMRIEK